MKVRKKMLRSTQDAHSRERIQLVENSLTNLFHHEETKNAKEDIESLFASLLLRALRFFVVAKKLLPAQNEIRRPN